MRVPKNATKAVFVTRAFVVRTRNKDAISKLREFHERDPEQYDMFCNQVGGGSNFVQHVTLYGEAWAPVLAQMQIRWVG